MTDIIRSRFLSLSKAEQKVARCILACPQEIPALSMADLAHKSGVSDATVVRLVKSIGLSSYTDLKLELTRHMAVKQHSEPLYYSDVTEKDETNKILDKVFFHNAQAINDTAAIADKELFSNVVERLSNAKKILAVGAGASQPFARLFAHNLIRLGFQIYSPIDAHLQISQAAFLNEEDAAIGISFSGKSRIPVSALKLARDRGAFTACFTINSKSPICRYSDAVLLCVGNEGRKYTFAAQAALIGYLQAIYMALSFLKPQMTTDQEEVISDSLEPLLLKSGV